MKATLLISIFFFFHSFVFSQTITYDASANYGTIEAASGTYQLMTTEPKAAEVFTSHLLYFIEAHREIKKTVILQIGNYTFVRILPANYINTPNFSPLSEEMITIAYDEIIPTLTTEPKN